MSLDVYLNVPGHRSAGGRRIFVREDGQTVEITREEWDRRHPDREPVTVDDDGEEVFWANITHNLNTMADAAGIYEALWRPEEIGVTAAGQLVPLLKLGLANLRAEPGHFRALNPANGWGDYDGLVRFVEKYLAACEENPEALVRTSR